MMGNGCRAWLHATALDMPGMKEVLAYTQRMMELMELLQSALSVEFPGLTPQIDLAPSRHVPNIANVHLSNASLADLANVTAYCRGMGCIVPQKGHRSRVLHVEECARDIADAARLVWPSVINPIACLEIGDATTSDEAVGFVLQLLRNAGMDVSHPQLLLDEARIATLAPWRVPALVG